MNSTEQIESSVSRWHAAELTAMRRMLIASDDTFSLSVAICNSPRLRDELIKLLVLDNPGVRIVRIPQGIRDVFTFVKDSYTQPPAASAVFLLGLEGLLSAGEDETNDRILRSLNAVRELWKEMFSCPVVFWLPEYAVDLLAHKARDLWAWRSHQFEFVTGYERLPADCSDFVDLQSQTETLIRWLTTSEPNVVIYGTAGVGKSTLAVRVAHRLSAEYPDGRIYVDMGDSSRVLSVRDAIERVLRVFDGAVSVPQEIPGARLMYEDFVRTRRILVIQDDVGNESQVLPRMSSAGGSALLVISRKKLRLPGFRELALGGMCPEDAAAFLVRRLGDKRFSREEITRLAETTSYSPLLTKLVGGFLNVHPDWSLTQYLNALRQAKSQELDRQLEEQETRATDETLKRIVAISLLDQPDLMRSWLMLSVFPGSFDLSGAAGVLDVSLSTAQRRLRELDDRGFVQYERATKRYRLHEFFQRLARDPQWRPPNIHPTEVRETLFAASQRHASHYLGILEELIARVPESQMEEPKTEEDVANRLQQEISNMIAGMAWSESNWQDAEEADEYCIRYALAVPALRRIGLAAEIATAWLQAGLEAARRRQNRKFQAELLMMLGDSLDAVEKADQRIQAYERAFHLVDPADTATQARLNYKLGSSLARSGRLDAARFWIERSIQNAQQAKWAEMEGRATHFLGWITLRQGEPKEALDTLTAASKKFAQLGSPVEEISVLADMAQAYETLGDDYMAIQNLQTALNMAYALSIPAAEADVLERLGTVYQRLEQPRQAIELVEQALRVSRGIGDRSREGQVLLKLGELQQQIGQTEEAEQYLQRVVSVAQEIDDPALQEAARRILAEIMLVHAGQEEAEAVLR
jgi:tetratricopeptide (TPR) repeat protein